MSTPTTDADFMDWNSRERTKAIAACAIKYDARDNKAVYRQLVWQTEYSRLFDVEKQLHTEMKLLPRTKELMMKYEKLHLRASDNSRRHHYPLMVERLNARREEFKLAHRNRPDVVATAMLGFDEEIQTIEERQPAMYDWDKYFLDRKLTDYRVNSMFGDYLSL